MFHLSFSWTKWHFEGWWFRSVVKLLPKMHRVLYLNPGTEKTNAFYIWLWVESYWGLNSGPHACYTGTPALNPLHQPCFVLGIFQTGLSKSLAQAVFEVWFSSYFTSWYIFSLSVVFIYFLEIVSLLYSFQTNKCYLFHLLRYVQISHGIIDEVIYNFAKFFI
jgi:hypothetical protein